MTPSNVGWSHWDPPIRNQSSTFSEGQFMATLACQEGQTVNGKEGVDKKKLFCKCNKKSGKCKWKNEANKKVSKDCFRIIRFLDQWEKSAKYEILKRQNTKNGNALVMLLKSQLRKSQPEMAVVLVVVLKLFLQQMDSHVFLLFMEAVVMVRVSHMTKVWDILWMLLVIISNLFLHLPHKMDFGWEIHQDRI